MLTPQQLQRAAGEMGFPVDAYEKVWMLVRLLRLVASHPFLGPRVALKGGTALNLFMLDVPRLSVDVDINYVGAAERETMLAQRPRIEQALLQVVGRLGLAARRIPSEHAGGKWRLAYTSALGRPGVIEVDINFVLRTPLWTPKKLDSRIIGGEQATGITVLDEHELAAGKLAALFARGAARDLYDARELLGQVPLAIDKLRLAFVVYGGINRRDWRAVSVEDAATTEPDVRRRLLPMLRTDVRPDPDEVEGWVESLIRETRKLLVRVLPLSDDELAFLARLNDGGEIIPELLTEDEELRGRIRDHPGLRWKALNVRKHRGLNP